LDLMMPGMSGWDVLHHVSSTMPRVSDRVVVVTAVGREQIDRIDDSLYGSVLEKPFDPAEFYESVERCYHTSKLEDDGSPGETAGEEDVTLH
ncbi:MAG: hypothetical protein R3338_14340, partial [Thermoanaerobaculia bacterium]|nr:hypothetical protein [Thermoanaerobaculia bacterium]